MKQARAPCPPLSSKVGSSLGTAGLALPTVMGVSSLSLDGSNSAPQRAMSIRATRPTHCSSRPIGRPHRARTPANFATESRRLRCLGDWVNPRQDVGTILPQILCQLCLGVFVERAERSVDFG